MTARPAFVLDILAQPEQLRRFAFGEASAVAARAKATIADAQTVILTGMGASVAALRPFWLDLIRAGRPALLVDTAELIEDGAALLKSSSVVIAASQSGRSAETMVLIELCAEARCPIVGLTNSPEGPLGQASRYCLLIGAGDERAVSTKTYLNTLAAAAVLARAVLPSAPPFDRDAAAEAVARLLVDFEARVAQLATEPIGERLYILGRGKSLAAANYGALIAKEAAKWPVEAQNAAQFRHGPLELADDRLSVVLFAGFDPVSASRTAVLRDALASYGARPLWSGIGTGVGPLDLPQADEVTLTLLEAVATQILAVALAQRAGIEPGRFRHLEKVTTAL